jgi:bifunctional DNA-binding transcriptional regulator/antitoxin component of YhaV-PrlF toxin-antitoxin module
MFKYNTKITGANPHSISLRATIPKEVVTFLELEKGNTLEWIVNVSDNSVKVEITKKE